MVAVLALGIPAKRSKIIKVIDLRKPPLLLATDGTIFRRRDDIVPMEIRMSVDYRPDPAARSSADVGELSERTKKNTPTISDRGVRYRRLTMTYSHMGKPHTTIGDASFHF